MRASPYCEQCIQSVLQSIHAQLHSYLFPWMLFLVEWVPFGFVLGRVGFFVGVSVGVCVCFFFFDLLSLLVIHLRERCRYQPQGSLWLALRYLRCLLKCANTSSHSGGYLLLLILYDREKKYTGLLQDKKMGPGRNLETDLFDHDLNIIINWPCEESTGIPKKDIVLGTFLFLPNGNTFGRYDNSRDRRKVNRFEDLFVLRLHSVVWKWVSYLTGCDNCSGSIQKKRIGKTFCHNQWWGSFCTGSKWKWFETMEWKPGVRRGWVETISALWRGQEQRQSRSK